MPRNTDAPAISASAAPIVMGPMCSSLPSGGPGPRCGWLTRAAPAVLLAGNPLAVNEPEGAEALTQLGGPELTDPPEIVAGLRAAV